MKKILAVLVCFMVTSCSSTEVKPGYAHTLYDGLVQLHIDGVDYSCHEISEYNTLSLMCRKNPVRSR